MGTKTFKTGKVYYKDQFAGLISETETGYRFAYDPNYLQGDGKPISLSLPLRLEPYESQKLFSFFDGLLPEGWYREIVCKVLKIDTNNSFGLLLNATSGDTIGAVTVSKVE